VSVLVDTSVWSAALRRGGTGGPDPTVVAELTRLIHAGQAALIGPIRQELLSGIRVTRQAEELEKRLAVFPNIPIGTEDYASAARCFNTCRAKGVQGSNTDFLICAVAIRTGTAIYTLDRDFALFARHLPIVLHVPSAADPGLSVRPS